MHDAPKSTCGPYLFELLKKKVSRFIFGCDFKKIFILILIFFFFFIAIILDQASVLYFKTVTFSLQKNKTVMF
jgi:hypothetical protein